MEKGKKRAAKLLGKEDKIRVNPVTTGQPQGEKSSKDGYMDISADARSVYDRQWHRLERTYREVNGKSDKEIKSLKKTFQNNCIEAEKGIK